MANLRKNLATMAATAGIMVFTMGNDGCSEQNERLEKLQKDQAAYDITYSIERDNINKRLELSNDPTQIGWIYCLSETGQMILESTYVGKVTSSGKRLEPRTGDKYGGYDLHPIAGAKYTSEELMGADGTFGSSDDYIYWFTPEGQYLKWNGTYIESNFPLKLAKPLLNVRDINYEEMARAKKAEQALKDGKKVNNRLEVQLE